MYHIDTHLSSTFFQLKCNMERAKLVECRRCHILYVPHEFQSHELCEICKPPVEKLCIHGVSMLKNCDECMVTHNSHHIRTWRNTGVYRKR